MDTSEIVMATTRRDAILPQASRLYYVILDNSSRFCTLCQVSSILSSAIHDLTCHSFFNVEKTQVRPEAAIQIHYTEAGGITGHIMLLCMLLIFTTSHAKIRAQSFETFWYTHHLFVPFLLSMYTHATGCFVRSSAKPYSPFAGNDFWDNCLGYEGWRWELVAGFIYLCERVYREVRSRRDTQITKVIRHPYDAVEIQIRKPSFKYKAGQWLFLNCPSVSAHQWHPFTITSCPFDSYVSIHVRQVGDWTKDLANALGAGPVQAKLYNELDPMGIYEIALDHADMPAVRIDGPYGAPAEDVFDNEVAILIGTGIGVTPWAAILKNIWHLRRTDAARRLRRVEFIWVCKDTSSFEWFQALLSSLEAQSLNESISPSGGGNASFLRIHTYLTQRLDLDAANNIVLNSVGTAKDPLTELDSRTNFGRPDFDKLFQGISAGILNESYMGKFDRRLRTDVGVYFCGPNAAARSIHKACKNASLPQVKFRFWKEHF